MFSSHVATILEEKTFISNISFRFRTRVRLLPLRRTGSLIDSVLIQISSTFPVCLDISLPNDIQRQRI